LKIEKVEGLLIGSDLLGANYVVRITTDTGITGVGQSGAWGFPDATQKVVEQYSGYLVGQDPMRIEHIQQTLYRMRPFRGNIISGALSAVDIALWDIKGKHYGAPAWELLTAGASRACPDASTPSPGPSSTSGPFSSGRTRCAAASSGSASIGASTSKAAACCSRPRARSTSRSDCYVNVHTTDFPDGAIRGQLEKWAPGRP
jgi:L-alanine-DL-glutamate epimerase-like enolase superfamily enzyme